MSNCCLSVCLSDRRGHPDDAARLDTQVVGAAAQTAALLVSLLYSVRIQLSMGNVGSSIEGKPALGWSSYELRVYLHVERNK